MNFQNQPSVPFQASQPFPWLDPNEPLNFDEDREMGPPLTLDSVDNFAGSNDANAALMYHEFNPTYTPYDNTYSQQMLQQPQDGYWGGHHTFPSPSGSHLSSQRNNRDDHSFQHQQIHDGSSISMFGQVNGSHGLDIPMEEVPSSNSQATHLHVNPPFEAMPMGSFNEDIFAGHAWAGTSMDNEYMQGYPAIDLRPEDFFLSPGSGSEDEVQQEPPFDDPLLDGNAFPAHSSVYAQRNDTHLPRVYDNTPSQESYGQTNFAMPNQGQYYTPYPLSDESTTQSSQLNFPHPQGHFALDNGADWTHSYPSSNAVEPTLDFDALMFNLFLEQNQDLPTALDQVEQHAATRVPGLPMSIRDGHVTSPVRGGAPRISGRGTSSSPISIPESPEGSVASESASDIIIIPSPPLSNFRESGGSSSSPTRTGNRELVMEGTLSIRDKTGEKEVLRRVMPRQAVEYNVVKKIACEACRASKTKCEFFERKDICNKCILKNNDCIRHITVRAQDGTVSEGILTGAYLSEMIPRSPPGGSRRPPRRR